MKEPRFNIAVYGTLKLGCSNHYLLRDSGAVFMHNATLKGRMYTNGHYPVFDFNGDKEIAVEVWNVDLDTFCIQSIECLNFTHQSKSLWEVYKGFGHLKELS